MLVWVLIMNIKVVRCCFAGHSDLFGKSEEVTKRIEAVAEELILNYGVNEFWVGSYGSFDGCSGCVIRELKQKYPDVSLELVIPYLKKGLIEYKKLYEGKFDNILIADIPENKPRKFHITSCNEYMVDNSDYVICYIEHTWGGAYNTYKYAKRKKKQIFNVAEKPIE